MLSTQDDNSPARRLYHGMGFTDLLTGFSFPGGGPPYAVMGAAAARGRPLPPLTGAEAEQLVDLPGRPRPVQGVEVQARHALGEQPLAHPRRRTRRRSAGRRPCRRRARAGRRPAPGGNRAPDSSDRALDPGDADDRHDPGDDRHVAAARRDRVAQPQVVIGVEEHLGDREVRARAALADEEVDVGRRARRPRVALGERAPTPTQNSPDDLISRTSSAAYSQALGVRLPLPAGSPGGSPRRASRLRTPDRRVRADDVPQLGHRVADRGQVPDQRQRGLRGDPAGDPDRAVPGRAAGAVGDRHEGRAAAARAGGWTARAAAPRPRSWAA